MMFFVVLWHVETHGHVSLHAKRFSQAETCVCFIAFRLSPENDNPFQKFFFPVSFSLISKEGVTY